MVDPDFLIMTVTPYTACIPISQIRPFSMHIYFCTPYGQIHSRTATDGTKMESNFYSHEVISDIGGESSEWVACTTHGTQEAELQVSPQPPRHIHRSGASIGNSAKQCKRNHEPLKIKATKHTKLSSWPDQIWEKKIKGEGGRVSETRGDSIRRIYSYPFLPLPILACLVSHIMIFHSIGKKEKKEKGKTRPSWNNETVGVV